MFTILVFFATLWLNVHLFREARYSLFPVQDTGLMIGSLQGDQSISFQSMQNGSSRNWSTIVQDDPAVATVVGVTGGRQVNSGFVYISLKPYEQRKITADGVVDAAAPRSSPRSPGARLFLVAVSDLRVGRAADQCDLSIYPAVRRHDRCFTNGRRG